MKTAKFANVIVKRLEERAPGEGVPAGWMPEIVYHLTATDIPYRPEKPGYTISLRTKGLFILRRLAVSPTCVDDWELSVGIGPKLVQAVTSARMFGESSMWPPQGGTYTVRPNEDILLTLFRRTLSVSKTFECVFRGAEEVAPL